LNTTGMKHQKLQTDGIVHFSQLCQRTM